MTELLAGSMAFPTVIYSILLTVVLIYWLFVILGALDIDMLDFDAEGLVDGAAEGATEGAAEALDGALDGAADGAADALDGALDGAAEGATEGIGEGLGEAADAADAVDGGAGVFAELLSALKLRSVPITVSFSFIVLFGWFVSLTASDLLAGVAGGTLIALGVGVGALVVALPLTSLAIRPLGGFFVTHGARGRGELVGTECTVSTGRVDHRFGQAYCTMGHDELLIQVRCDKANTLKKNDEALIIEWDTAREAFVIEPMHG